LKTRFIALLTDFGLRDAFAGVMKGVIAQGAPGARVIDLTHEIPPQDVRAAAVVLWTAYRYFPPRTIFVPVVDPGVGTRRRILAAETAEGVFLAPDNGLLTLVFRDSPPCRVVTVQAHRYRRPDLSATFHGRDLFAPVAARLARGLAVSRLGPPARDWVTLPFGAPVRRTGGGAGEVLHVDRFGNAMTNLPGAWGRLGAAVFVRGRRVTEVVTAYGDVPRGRALAVVSSAGTLEIAVNGGDAADRFKLRPGSRVDVRSPLRVP
jgi:S-adenosylmethionine hydrolase